MRKRRQCVVQDDRVLVPTSKGTWHAVDVNMLELAQSHSWNEHSYGYAECKLWAAGRCVSLRLSRLVMKDELAQAPEGATVDHINGDTRDNRKCNLRVVSRSDNQKNQKRRSDNTSGFKGVVWHAQSRKWRARIYHDKKPISLGLFSSKEDAARAYREAATRLFGTLARAPEHE